MSNELQTLIGFILIIISAILNILISNNRLKSRAKPIIASVFIALTGFLVLIG